MSDLRKFLQGLGTGDVVHNSGKVYTLSGHRSLQKRCLIHLLSFIMVSRVSTYTTTEDASRLALNLGAKRRTALQVTPSTSILQVLKTRCGF